MIISKENPYLKCGEWVFKRLQKPLQETQSIKEETMNITNETSQTEKKPLFKVGQIVRIKVREGNENDYAYAFTDAMAEYSGRLCTIEKVHPNYNSIAYRYPDDGAKYELKESGPDRFNWASSMLEEAELPKPTYRVGQKVRIVKRQIFDGEPLIYGTVHYNDNMLKHRGEVHEIEGIKFYTGAFLPQDDYHIYRLKNVDYSWTKSMLKPIEEEQKPEVAVLEKISENIDKAYESYKSLLKADWPKDAKFHFNQKVQIASVITNDVHGFTKKMIDYAGNEASIEIATRSPMSGEYFYRLDEENGGDILWPESLLTEIN